MPRSKLGQLITFAIEQSDDVRFEDWVVVPVRRNDTVGKIAARRGHPEDARRIADKNGIRSVRSKLGRDTIRVPGELKSEFSFSVLAGDQRPTVSGGYAKYEIVDRPGRVGLLMFTGYDPLELTVPVRFQAPVDGQRSAAGVEDDIELLEKMAGRGNFPGASVGPAPLIRVSVTNGQGGIVPLVPKNYQWTPANPRAPLYRVVDIDWDAGAISNSAGNRTTQKATIVLKQQATIALLTGVVDRVKAKPKPKPKTPSKGKGLAERARAKP